MAYCKLLHYYITYVHHGVKFQCDELMLKQMAAVKVIGSHTSKSFHIALKMYPCSLGKKCCASLVNSFFKRIQ